MKLRNPIRINDSLRNYMSFPSQHKLVLRITVAWAIHLLNTRILKSNLLDISNRTENSLMEKTPKHSYYLSVTYYSEPQSKIMYNGPYNNFSRFWNLPKRSICWIQKQKKKQKNFVHEWNKKIKLRKSVHKNTLWQ